MTSRSNLFKSLHYESCVMMQAALRPCVRRDLVVARWTRQQRDEMTFSWAKSKTHHTPSYIPATCTELVVNIVIASDVGELETKATGRSRSMRQTKVVPCHSRRRALSVSTFNSFSHSRPNAAAAEEEEKFPTPKKNNQLQALDHAAQHNSKKKFRASS